ncbi:MAG: ABC transporter substrate-binding protein, partial [bacterium]|nr:ABC transporter substrate-binding protein [bacterium]
PGWHEPGTIVELIVNKQAFEGLPKDLQSIVRAASARASVWALAEFESKNNLYLQKLTGEHGVVLKKFPDPVLKALRQFAGEVIEDVISADAKSRKVYDSFSAFQKNILGWANISEKVYYESIGG